MQNRKIVLIGKNGAGKTKYIGQNIFGKYLDSNVIGTLEINEPKTFDVFGG